MAGEERSRGRSGRARVARGARIAVVAGLVLAMFAAMLPTGRPTVVRAQEVTYATAAITPADVSGYIALPLVQNEQWAQASALMERTGKPGGWAEYPSTFFNTFSGVNLAFPISDPAIMGGEVAIGIRGPGGFYHMLGKFGPGLLSDTLAPALGVDDLREAGASAADTVLILSPVDLATAAMYVDGTLYGMAGQVGAAVAVEDYKGIAVASATAVPEAKFRGYAYAILVDKIVIAASPAAIYPYIDTLAGELPALSSSEQFAAANAALPTDRLVFGYFDGAVLQAATEASTIPGKAVGLGLSTAMGTDHALGLAISALPVGFQIDSVDIPAKAGEAAQAAGPPTGLTMAAKVPAEADLFINAYADGAGPAIDTIGTAILTMVGASLGVGSLDSGPFGVLSGLASEFIGFDFASDLTGGLTGEMVIAMWNYDPADPLAASAILGGGAGNPTALGVVGTGLTKLAPMVLGESAASGTAMIGGSEVPEVTFTTQSGMPGKLDVGVVGDQFVLGLNDGAAAMVDGSSSSLLDNADFSAAMALLPADHDGILYVELTSVAYFHPSVPMSTTEAPAECANYSSRDEAQAAFNADPVGLAIMDSNGNGTVCDDYMGQPIPASESGEPLVGITSYTMVSYVEGGLDRTRGILMIAE